MISFIVILAILATTSSQRPHHPDCGKVTPQADPLVVGGARARHGELPWHVGVYQKTTRPYRQICGGSIVSRKLVISAAHCFWNPVEKLTEASRYAVAGGKIYKPWDEPHDADAQKSDVTELVIPPLFRGVDRNFAEDLALLVLEQPFEYQPYLRPVCLDFEPHLEDRQLKPGVKGRVAGWGLTSASGALTSVLNVVSLPVVSTEVCLLKSPKSYWEYITIDKLCAGYDNGDATLCQGDSGGGLSFPHLSALGVERYFLRGVVSTSPSSSTQCNAFAITSFTRVSAHKNFIERYRQHMDPLPLITDTGSPSTRMPDAVLPTDLPSNSTQNQNNINEVLAYLANISRRGDDGMQGNTSGVNFLSQYQPPKLNRSSSGLSNRNFSRPSMRRLSQTRPTLIRNPSEQADYFDNQPTQYRPESDSDARFRRIQAGDWSGSDNDNRFRPQPDYNNQIAIQNNRMRFNNRMRAQQMDIERLRAEDAYYNQELARNQGARVNQRDPIMFNQNIGPFAPTRTEEFTSTNTRCVNGQCTEDQEARSVLCVNGDCSVSENRPSFGSSQPQIPGFFS